MGVLTAVNLGALTEAAWVPDLGRTGIDKRPTSGRVRVTHLGLTGDTIADTSRHGGADQAVYAYATTDAAWWAGELGRTVAPGNFGENFTTDGIDITGALIGERWAIGGTVLEVNCPRVPCRVFAGFWVVPDLIKRFTARATPGAYLRVLVEGEVGAGDPIEVIHRPTHGVTVGMTFRALMSDASLLPRLLDAPELCDKAKDVVHRRLARNEASNQTSNEAVPASTASTATTAAAAAPTG